MSLRLAVDSERHEVGRKDAYAPVAMTTLPPIVLRLGLGNHGDAVAGDEAQVAGLLPRERVRRLDNELSTSSSPCVVRWVSGGKLA